MRPNFYTVLFFALLSFSVLQAQDSLTIKETWYHKCPDADRINGISSERAYKELVPYKVIQPVIVAVIDGGTDITHEDLKDVLWVNSGEIPNDSIDNDGNGDIVFSSASFAADKPHLYMIEHGGTLDVSEKNSLVPNEVVISQNYPNPFNPETTLQYSIPADGLVSIKVYDILGNKIKTLIEQWKSAGAHTEMWNGQNDNSQAVSSGVYFYQIKVGDKQVTKKMIFAK